MIPAGYVMQQRRVCALLVGRRALLGAPGRHSPERAHAWLEHPDQAALITGYEAPPWERSR